MQGDLGGGDSASQETPRLSAEALYRLLFEESKDAIFLSRPNGQIVDINAAGLALFAIRDKKEILEADLGGLLYQNAAERTRLFQRLQRDGHVRDHELRLKTRDGRNIVVLETSTVVRGTDGRATAYLGILRDITERRELETRLLAAQKMEAVGRLAGGIAHDFRNIMMVIRGCSDIAAGKIPSESPAHEDLASVTQAIQRAVGMTDQLLTFSRREPDKPEVIDLSAVVNEMGNLLRRSLGSHISLETHLAESPWTVLANRSQMEQVLLNLAVNARDAMPNGGRLVLSTENVVLDESYSKDVISVPPGHYVRLSVSDDGIGMDKETTARAFDPFFSTKERGEGTGLGLATVYGIVKQSAGFVWVYSEQGVGTTFKIYLPRVEASGKQLPPKETLSGPLSGSETVLVVDDDSTSRRLVVQVLRHYGYRAESLDNADDARQLLEAVEKPVDLLITDLILGSESGRDLAEAARKRRPDLPVLVISGYAEHTITGEDDDLSISFLQKPFSPLDLARGVREILDG
ncbi:MAG: ATP-binding protein [Thermoanaerobaculia bacterium]